MIEEIKKEISKINIHECDIEDIFEILDKYDTKDMIIIPHNSNEKVPEELKTILKLSTDVMFLKDENNTLNKGIDELIKKYEDKITIYTESDILVKEIITDLKALKEQRWL